MVARRYQTVFTGGGDGTFVSWVNRIIDASERRHQRAPRFGVLALGTGNAVAEMVGATPRHHVRDLSRFLAGRVHATRRIDLVTCEGRRTPFAGVGVDAAILNDYIWLKDRLAGTPLQSLGLGVAGYGLAVALRSAPRQLLERRPTYCEIVNTGREAWRLDGQGRRRRPGHRPGRAALRRPLHDGGRQHRPLLRHGAADLPARRQGARADAAAGGLGPAGRHPAHEPAPHLVGRLRPREARSTSTPTRSRSASSAPCRCRSAATPRAGATPCRSAWRPTPVELVDFRGAVA